MDIEKTYAFCAMLSRMKYINRWGLMRAARSETLSEHTTEASVTAHVLALLARDVCGEADVRPDAVAVAALYHDAGEILTGDMPTPVKYKNEALRTAYKDVERESARSLAAMLPEELQKTLAPVLAGDSLNEMERRILKAADIISALAKCIEEENAGNMEFREAKKQQLLKLRHLGLPAADLFVAQFLPCYAYTLDELVDTGGTG